MIIYSDGSGPDMFNSIVFQHSLFNLLSDLEIRSSKSDPVCFAIIRVSSEIDAEPCHLLTDILGGMGLRNEHHIKFVAFDHFFELWDV